MINKTQLGKHYENSQKTNMKFCYILSFVRLLFTTLLNSKIVLKNQTLPGITWYMERLQSFIKYCVIEETIILKKKRSFVGNPWFATLVPHAPSPVDKLLWNRICSIAVLYLLHPTNHLFHIDLIQQILKKDYLTSLS